MLPLLEKWKSHNFVFPVVYSFYKTPQLLDFSFTNINKFHSYSHNWQHINSFTWRVSHVSWRKIVCIKVGMIKRKQYNSPNHTGHKKSIEIFLTQIEISKKIYWRIFLLMQWVSYEGMSLNMWYIVDGEVKNPISWILINTFPLKRLQPNKPNPCIDNKRLVGTLGVDVILPTLFYDTLLWTHSWQKWSL